MAPPRKRQDDTYKLQPRTEVGQFGSNNPSPLASKILGVRLTQQQMDDWTRLESHLENKAGWLREVISKAIAEKLEKEGINP